MTLGALNLRIPLHRQLLIAVAALALTSLPLLVAGSSVTLLAIAVFVSGIAISPTFITAFGLIERRVPESVLTEGVTWVMTGIGIGMALGAFVTGWVVDSYGPQSGFWVSAAAGAATVLIIALGQRKLGRVHRRGRLRDAGTGAIAGRAIDRSDAGGFTGQRFETVQGEGSGSSRFSGELTS